MNQAPVINVERRIKKHINAAKHTVELIAQPGFQEATVHECELLVGKKHTRLDKNHLIVSELSYDEVLKLLYLSKTVDDVWFELAHFRFKGLLPLTKQLADSLLPLAFSGTATEIEFKVDIIKSHFQEKDDLKKALELFCKKQIRRPVVPKAERINIVVHVRLFRDVLHIFVPLAGEPLYKRGYRADFNGDAPLRETIASCALQTLFKGETTKPDVDALFVPFGGTGTLLFEYWLWLMDAPITGRPMQLEQLAFYRKEKCAHLIKQQTTNLPNIPLQSIYCDNSHKAQISFAANCNHISQVYESVKFFATSIEMLTDDFLELKRFDFSDLHHLLIPLNPPFGIRLAKNSVDDLYVRITKQLVKIRVDNPQLRISGFLLCPTELSWNQALVVLKGFQHKTQHFMHGGLDIRIIIFKSNS